jgi:heme-degrading monooxygenase HmoA
VRVRFTNGDRKEGFMYARVLWGKIKMGMWDEYERYYDQKIISSTDGVKGFRGRRLLRSLENPDEGISISLWETKEDMENYVKALDARSWRGMRKSCTPANTGSSTLK